jgi:hypothetical protein
MRYLALGLRENAPGNTVINQGGTIEVPMKTGNFEPVKPLTSWMSI